MLTELCEYLRNWFCEDSDMVIGTIAIRGGSISVPYSVCPRNGQYIRIIGSVFNDGVVRYGEDELEDETFDGAVWLMRVPKAVVKLAEDIAEWREKYESVDSPSMSPYNSESFAGYSYSKAGAVVASDGTSVNPNTWQSAFASRIAPWRKL